MSVIAPFNITEGNRVPYVTIQEVLNSATAASVDFSNLIPGASINAQNVALQELIVKASTEADNYCLGALGTLCATVNTENGRYRGNRQGQFIIQPYYWPILELRSFGYGYNPGVLNNVTLNNTNTFIERNQFIITAQSGVYSGTTYGSLDMVGGKFPANQQFCQWTYVNGFANTFSDGAVTAGATSITVDSAIGIYAGSQLTIWDGAKDETIIIASSYNGTSLTLPLASPLQYAHTTDVNVSALPATIKQAVIHLIVAMVKERGSGALVINEIGEPLQSTAKTSSQEWDKASAYDLLDAFKQIWGRA
jgi:hypothetical protein